MTQRLVIAGTGTEVGKTWTAVRLLQHARARGLSVAARKPSQSYAEGDEKTDADLLGAASGEAPEIVCPRHRWYAGPMAPPMAADVLVRPRILLAQLIAETTWPSGGDLALIETAGGLCSPIAHDADNLALIQRLAPTKTVLVADAGLGTINAVRLCVRALQGLPTIVFLNRFEQANQLHRRNWEWLRGEGVEAVTDLAAVTE